MEELSGGPPGPWRHRADPRPREPVATLDLGPRPRSTGAGAEPAPEPDPEPESGPTPAPGPARVPTAPARTRFARFVVTEADHLFGTAYLLTGDRDQAENLLRAALAGAGLHWTHRHTDPVADVLRELVRRTSGPIWWWPRPSAAAALPGPIGTGLDRFTSRHRAAVVLRYHQRCTEEETAAALAAPAGNVRSWLSRALDHLGIDTRLDLRPQAGSGLSRSGLSAELCALAALGDRPRTDDVTDAGRLQARLADVRARMPGLRRHERRRRIGLAALIAVTIVVTIVVRVRTG